MESRVLEGLPEMIIFSEEEWEEMMNDIYASEEDEDWFKR